MTKMEELRDSIEKVNKYGGIVLNPDNHIIYQIEVQKDIWEDVKPENIEELKPLTKWRKLKLVQEK